jgi:hypothetical protein
MAKGAAFRGGLCCTTTFESLDSRAVWHEAIHLTLFGGATMKTANPVKKTGKLTAKKIEKKAPLLRLG